MEDNQNMLQNPEINKLHAKITSRLMVFMINPVTNCTATLTSIYLRTLLHVKTDPLHLLRGAGNFDKIWSACGQHEIQCTE
jgi:hypothetical protein